MKIKMMFSIAILLIALTALKTSKIENNKENAVAFVARAEAMHINRPAVRNFDLKSYKL